MKKTSEFAELARAMNVPLESDMKYMVDSSDLMAKCPSKYGEASVNNAKNVDKPFAGTRDGN